MKALWKLLPAAVLALGTVAVVPAAASASSAPGKDTAYITAYKISSATMIDDAGGRQANGNTIQMWTHGTKANEMWNIEALGSGGFKMQLTANPAYCLDLTGGSLTSGTKVQLWKCISGDENQVWTYPADPVAYGNTIFPEKALSVKTLTPDVLDANGGKNGAPLEVRPFVADGFNDPSQLFHVSGDAGN
jgi:hypothetical protein